MKDIYDKNVTEQIKYLPTNSGCYLYKDADNKIIYIGKAKNLKKRVSSYFNKNHDSPKLNVLVPQIVKIEFIITDSEIEALILESHLIKKHKPKYNILLKDDKKFPYFLITNEEYPRIRVIRKANLNPEKGKYFGPYTDARAMYTTLELIKKIFPLKQCKTPKFKDRPCIYYQIGRCLAPCQKIVSSEDYHKVLKNVELFLSGRQQELADKLLEQMQYYSDKEDYEKAAKFRDSYLDVSKTLERQKVVFENTNINNDIISLTSSNGIFAIVVLQIRSGRLINRKDFSYFLTDLDSETEVLNFFLKDYYQIVSVNEIPNKIIIAEKFKNPDVEIYSEFLSRKFAQKVKITLAKTTKDKELLELANKNANFLLDKLKREKILDIVANYNEIGSYLKEKLELRKFPHKVECFDISHIQGTNTVASMVIFENGIPQKSKYRKFKIKTLEENKPDDFKAMTEVVERRYKKLSGDEMPDLIIIDGGKGQLSSVMKVFEKLAIKNQDIISLAKRLEEVFKPGMKSSIILPTASLALHFFQQIRDEAHRFAITYHRQLRAKSALKTELDNIKNLRQDVKVLLLKKFNSVQVIAQKTLAELCVLIDKKTAQKVFNYFHK